MRADNKGEGGVLALATLATKGLAGRARAVRGAIVLFAIIGLALFYGDAIITPAMTIMSAGRRPRFGGAGSLSPYVVPMSLAILVVLFMLQSRGTAGVGRLFGPVMLVWFLVLGVLGVWQDRPQSGRAGRRQSDVRRQSDRRPGTGDLLGVRPRFVLAVTGAEALYGRHGPFRPASRSGSPGCSSSCRA